LPVSVWTIAEFHHSNSKQHFSEFVVFVALTRSKPIKLLRIIFRESHDSLSKRLGRFNTSAICYL